MTIADIICNYMGVSTDDVLKNKKSRKQPWPMLRFLIMYFEYKYLNKDQFHLNFAKHRTMLYHALKAVENEKIYASFTKTYNNIEYRINLVGYNINPEFIALRSKKSVPLIDSAIYELRNWNKEGDWAELKMFRSRKEAMAERTCTKTAQYIKDSRSKHYFRQLHASSVIDMYSSSKKYALKQPDKTWTWYE